MSELKEQLKVDLNAAMKAKDDVAKSSLRMAIAAISNAEVAGDEARSLSLAEEQAILTKEVRKREDSAQVYADAGRAELAEKETAEARFLERYLPAALTEDELLELVAAEVAAVEASLGERPSMKQMGAIVKAVNEKAAGRADGKTVATLVRRALD